MKDRLTIRRKDGGVLIESSIVHYSASKGARSLDAKFEKKTCILADPNVVVSEVYFSQEYSM